MVLNLCICQLFNLVVIGLVSGNERRRPLPQLILLSYSDRVIGFDMGQNITAQNRTMKTTKTLCTKSFWPECTLRLQWFFLGLYGLAILGMGTLLLLHSCRKLATGGKGRPDKKRGFTLGGIFSKIILTLKYKMKRNKTVGVTVCCHFPFVREYNQ